jgi:hypothetical protein
MLIETTSNSSPTVHCTSFSDFTVASSTRLQSIGHVWYAKTKSVGLLPSKKSPSLTGLPSVSRNVGVARERAPEVLDDVDPLELGRRRVRDALPLLLPLLRARVARPHGEAGRQRGGGETRRGRGVHHGWGF